jgi:heptosyltransferase-1
MTCFQAADQPRILLVRLSAIGDIVFALPLIHAIRQRWPKAYLAWLVQSEYAELLRQQPSLDAVLEWPWSTLRTLLKQGHLITFWRHSRLQQQQLQADRFDIVIDLQGLLKSAWPSWLTGAPTRIGLGSREGSRWLMTQVYPRYGASDWISSEYRFLADQFGCAADSWQFAIQVGDDSQAQAHHHIVRLGLQEPFIALCPFTTRPQKHWLPERWGMLAQQLQDDYGWPIVMLGGPTDQVAAHQLMTTTSAVIHTVVGQTPLMVAMALLARAAVVIGVDTGLSHSAVALQRPTVLLFLSTRPYRHTGVPQVQVLSAACSCAPCRRHPTCRGRFDCMYSITVTQVLNAVRTVLPPAAQL